jgi:hypothetical protein
MRSTWQHEATASPTDGPLGDDYSTECASPESFSSSPSDRSQQGFDHSISKHIRCEYYSMAVKIPGPRWSRLLQGMNKQITVAIYYTGNQGVIRTNGGGLGSSFTGTSPAFTSSPPISFSPPYPCPPGPWWKHLTVYHCHSYLQDTSRTLKSNELFESLP